MSMAGRNAASSRPAYVRQPRAARRYAINQLKRYASRDASLDCTKQTPYCARICNVTPRRRQTVMPAADAPVAFDA